LIDRGIVVDNARLFLAARMRERAIERVPIKDLLAGNWRGSGSTSVAPFFSGFVKIARTHSESEVRP
jgi:hypothetical protein